MATLSTTATASTITITGGGWDGVTATGDRFRFYQDAPGSNGSLHLGVGGLADWQHGAYSLTQALGNTYQSGDAGLYSWDNDGDIQTAATTAFAVADSNNTVYQAVHLKGGNYETFWQPWASGIHAVSKKANAALSVIPESGLLTAAFATSGAGGTSSAQQIFYNGTALGVAVALYTSLSSSTFDNVGEGAYTVYFLNGNGIAMGSGTISNTLIVLSGYDNKLSATVRDAIAADYRSHSSPNALTLTTGSVPSGLQDIYGTAGYTLASDGYDAQRGAWRVTASGNHVNVGGAASAWGISGSVTARFSPRFILHSWTGGSTPTVQYNGVTLTKGQDYECYADVTNSLLYVALLFDVGAGGVRSSTNVAAGATVGTLDINAAGGGGTITPYRWFISRLIPRT